MTASWLPIPASSTATPVVGSVQKISELPDGRFVGVCGKLQEAARARAWLSGETGFGRFRDTFECIVIDADGTVREAYGESPMLYTFDAPFHAIGSGSTIAIGAMAAGATAQEAVMA